MITYFILLAKNHDGSTLEWITDWLEEWGDEVMISTEGCTDKKENELILLEFDTEEDTPGADFSQELRQDNNIVDYIIYELVEVHE